MKVFVSQTVKELAAIIGEAASKIGMYPAYQVSGNGEVKEHCFLVPKSDAQKEFFIKNLEKSEVEFFVITDSGGRVEGFPSVFQITALLYEVMKVCQENKSSEIEQYYLYEEAGKVVCLYLQDMQSAEKATESFQKLLTELKLNFRVEEVSTVDIYKTEEQIRAMDFSDAVAYQDELIQAGHNRCDTEINRLFERVTNHILTFPQGWD